MVAWRQGYVGVACRRYLSNIMPDSIFYGSMGWGMTQFFCFFSLGVVIAVLLSMEEMDSVLSL